MRNNNSSIKENEHPQLRSFFWQGCDPLSDFVDTLCADSNVSINSSFGNMDTIREGEISIHNNNSNNLDTIIQGRRHPPTPMTTSMMDLDESENLFEAVLRAAAASSVGVVGDMNMNMDDGSMGSHRSIQSAPRNTGIHILPINPKIRLKTRPILDELGTRMAMVPPVPQFGFGRSSEVEEDDVGDEDEYHGN